jgi:hypothetical protein
MHFTIDKVKSDGRMEVSGQWTSTATTEDLVAENETLTIDDRTASRWEPLRERISSGHSPSSCFADIEREFYQGLRRACRFMRRRGVTLECLLTTAFQNPDALEDLVRQTRCQEYAGLLLNVVRCQVFLSLEQLVAAWLSAVWDSIRDLLWLDLSGHAHDSSFDARIWTMLQRLARLIACDPSRIPKRPRRRDEQPPDDLDDTLRRSIL